MLVPIRLRDTLTGLGGLRGNPCKKTGDDKVSSKEYMVVRYMSL